MRELRLLPAQLELVRDTTSPMLFFVAGLGAGKTRALVVKALALADANAPHPGIFIEPTYRMLMDVAYRMFVTILSELGVSYQWHASDKILSVSTSRGTADILMRSADTWETLQGTNLAWSCADECSYIDERSAQAVVNRVRIAVAPQRQSVFAGTSDSLGWFRDWAEAKPAPGSRLLRAPTQENWHNPPDYIERITAHMSPEDVQRYTQGIFVPPRGRVYGGFLRDRHVVKCANSAQGEAQIWCDFNVGLMVWLMVRVIGDEAHVFREIVVENTDTQTTTEAAARAWKAIGREPERVAFYADASGAARRTSATRSDHGWLSMRGFRNRSPNGNPAIEDRVASVNAMFRRNRLFVDPGCELLIRSLENQGRSSTGEPDKKSGLDHATDALGYGVHAQWMGYVPRGNAMQAI